MESSYSIKIEKLNGLDTHDETLYTLYIESLSAHVKNILLHTGDLTSYGNRILKSIEYTETSYYHSTPLEYLLLLFGFTWDDFCNRLAKNHVYNIVETDFVDGTKLHFLVENTVEYMEIALENVLDSIHTLEENMELELPDSAFESSIKYRM